MRGRAIRLGKKDNDARLSDHKTLEAIRERAPEFVEGAALAGGRKFGSFCSGFVVGPVDGPWLAYAELPSGARRGKSRKKAEARLAGYLRAGFGGLEAKPLFGRPPKLPGQALKRIFDTATLKNPLRMKFAIALPAGASGESGSKYSRRLRRLPSRRNKPRWIAVMSRLAAAPAAEKGGRISGDWALILSLPKDGCVRWRLGCGGWRQFVPARSSLASGGLLNHRRVTTHWLFSEALATAYPSIDVDASLLFARDGNIYTSGGITAGIDLALALVEEDHGREIALATARIMVVPIQRLYKIGSKESAGHQRTASLDSR